MTRHDVITPTMLRQRAQPGYATVWLVSQFAGPIAPVGGDSGGGAP